MQEGVALKSLRDRPFELEVDRFGMSDPHGHAHRCGADEDAGVPHDLLRLADHLDLFLAVAVFAELPIVRQDIARELSGVK